ncbi:hypothetical protein SBA3_1940022 [Candidatus Sulfopaludibacter sp. SbA3]|nr:hypothetical protein SBA3_1940022 [Candidatus Sulfopaludibacter sp. SbA3]
MTITIEIPEELVRQFVPAGQDPARATLEAIALEGYRSDRLSEAEIRKLLGFETPNGSPRFFEGRRRIPALHRRGSRS